MRVELLAVLLLSGCYDQEIVCEDGTRFYATWGEQKDRRVCEAKSNCEEIVQSSIDVDETYIDFGSIEETHSRCMSDGNAGCIYGDDQIYIKYLDDVIKSDLPCHEYLHIHLWRSRKDEDSEHTGPEFSKLYLKG